MYIVHSTTYCMYDVPRLFPDDDDPLASTRDHLRSDRILVVRRSDAMRDAMRCVALLKLVRLLVVRLVGEGRGMQYGDGDGSLTPPEGGACQLPGRSGVHQLIK